MTELLEKAFAAASELPEEEQNAVAVWLLDELASERRWQAQFSESQEELARLAAEALEEHKSGGTREFDPDSI